MRPPAGRCPPSSASVERSIAFLLPGVRGEKVHLEFVRSPVVLDLQRGEARIPAFKAGAPWDPRRGTRLLEMAGYFTPAFVGEPIRGQVLRTFQTVLNGLPALCRVR